MTRSSTRGGGFARRLLTSSIALLLLFSFASSGANAATIIQQNDTVVQASSIFFGQTEEYYANALADEETLVRVFFFSSFSLSLSLTQRRKTDRARVCLFVCDDRARGGEEDEAVEQRVLPLSVGEDFYFLKFRAGKEEVNERKRQRKRPTRTLALTFFSFSLSLSLSLSLSHTRIERVETDDHTINEHCRYKRKPGFVRVVRRDELLLHKLPEGFRRNRTVCRSRGRESGYPSGDFPSVEREHVGY